ncbi:MAG: hypothetical protein MK101_01415 [Phycisphaerales bacterium]|nr:hypothetical protein [Phycisphaerales bacterium]
MALPSDASQPQLDFGADWDQVEASIGRGNRGGGRAVATRDAQAVGVAIALGTFTGEGHRQQAAIALQGAAREASDLADQLSIHTDERGSMLVYGQYASFDDATLRRDLKRLKAYEVNGRRVFGLVLPAELRPPLRLEDLDPLDLRTVRLRNPDVRAIYTLEVAWWGPVGDAPAPKTALRDAQQLAQVLRRAGHEAYFLHEPHRQRASVCVGVFDYLAVDAASGIESTPVMQTRQSFPALQVNGKELRQPRDPRRPTGPKRAVPPPLIDVPRS